MPRDDRAHSRRTPRDTVRGEGVGRTDLSVLGHVQRRPVNVGESSSGRCGADGYGGLSVNLRPLTITAARAFVDAFHRHHKAPVSGLFAVGVETDGELIGVAIIGRPVARGNQDGYTAEVTRLAVLEGHPNACSMLYGAAWRAARALGYKRLITYTLVSESGGSLKASGWREVGRVTGRQWSCPSRPRKESNVEDKVRWEAGACG